MVKRVLVVDDESFSRTVIVATLRVHGFHCIEAKHGDDALRLLNKENFTCDLILTDLRMPVCNGIEFIKKIQSGKEAPESTKDIPIIVLSAEEGAMIDEAVELGISGYFIKKEPVEVLVPKLKQLLGLVD
ncbi:MAG: response regulator [Porticoccaceae bacterium]|nr:response regulator [Porticoccaceae bacterium]